MNRSILVSDPIAEEGVDQLRDQGFDLDIKTSLSSRELKNQVGKYAAMIVRSGTTVSSSVIDAADNLELIVRAGVGLDNIDLDYADEQGIEVINTPEASSNSVAELTVGHMLALARNIPKGTMTLKRGEWKKSALNGSELRGKVLGIIGIGRIGTLVAKKGLALGMKPVAYDEYVDEAPVDGVEMVSKEPLLSGADYVTLHVPFDPTVGAIIGAEELQSMKDSAYLINCARGGVVDEDALVTALQQSQIAGAGIDVYEQEPPGESDLIQHPRVTLTPHLGASTVEAQRRVGEQAAREVTDFFTKEA